MEYMEETALKKEPEITVLKVEPGKAPEEVTIPNTLEAMQQMVGGLIEIVYLDGVCLVCNEEGKLMGLEGNRRVGRDIISGTSSPVRFSWRGIRTAASSVPSPRNSWISSPSASLSRRPSARRNWKTRSGWSSTHSEGGRDGED